MLTFLLEIQRISNGQDTQRWMNGEQVLSIASYNGIREIRVDSRVCVSGDQTEKIVYWSLIFFDSDLRKYIIFLSGD